MSLNARRLRKHGNMMKYGTCFSKFARFVCVRYVVILKNRHLQHLLSKAIAAKPTFSTMATRSMRPVLLPLALLAAIAAPAFTGMSRATPRTRIPRAADNFIPLDAIEPTVSSYVYLGLHSESQLSKFVRKILRKWIDGVSMFFYKILVTVLVPFSEFLVTFNSRKEPGWNVPESPKSDRRTPR